jgi:hypothetical protein
LIICKCLLVILVIAFICRKTSILVRLMAQLDLQFLELNLIIKENDLLLYNLNFSQPICLFNQHVFLDFINPELTFHQDVIVYAELKFDSKSLEVIQSPRLVFTFPYLIEDGISPNFLEERRSQRKILCLNQMCLVKWLTLELENRPP